MFVLTKDCEILNLAQCIKIVVRKNKINAYAPVSDSPRSTNLVARFDTDLSRQVKGHGIPTPSNHYPPYGIKLTNILITVMSLMG